MDDTAGRRAALIAVTMISFSTPFMISGVNISLPAIGRELELSAIAQSWVTTIYSLSTGVFLLPFGKLADIYGRKRLFIIGVVLYTLASALCALAGSAATLLGSRAFQGIGAALIFATSTAILTSIYPPRQRGRVLGVNVAAVYVGLSVGPYLGGAMVEALGWRSVFWANVPLALLTLAFTLWKVKGEWADSPGESFDLLGSGVYGASVVALMIGFAQLPNLNGVWLILLGALAGAAFLWRQAHIATPLLELGLFRGSRVFTLSSIAALIDYASTISVTFLMSLYLQYIKGLSPREAGAVLVAQPVVQAIFSPVAGWISDRIAVRWVASLGLAFTLTGLVMLTRLNAATGMGYIVACLLVLGFGFALFSSPNTSAIMGAVRRRHYGVASGMVATMRTFGQMLGMGVVLILFGLFMGQVQITPANHAAFVQSVRVAFTISSALCAVALVASLARGEAPTPPEE
jgi:EmrB/QacA subfamily drug resistance transporter